MPAPGHPPHPFPALPAGAAMRFCYRNEQHLMILRFFRSGLLWLIAAIWLIFASTAVAGGPREGILWQIQRDGQPVGHLFGTVHSDRPEVLDLHAPVREVFEQSRQYAFELDIREVDPLQAARLMRYRDARSLQDQLPPQLWQRARDAAGQMGLPPAAITALKPWALAILLSLPPTDPQRVLDHHLQRRALEFGRPVTGLETMAEQLSLFNELEHREQIDLLRQALDQVESGLARQLYNDIIDAWLASDLARLAELAQAHPALPEANDNDALMDALLLERNRRMIRRMEPLLADGGVFVAVGAMHLVGEDGLVRLLEQQGYTMTPLY